MLLGFSYLYVCNVFLQKAENNFKKASWPKICNIIFVLFLFLLIVVSVEPVNQQINFVLP